MWEASLMGPYDGVPFTETTSSRPVSTLFVHGYGQLEVHEISDQTVPLLLLRAPDGGVRWQRLLQPERRYKDGSASTAFLRELRLHRIQRDPVGYRVQLSCDWEWGGREGGLIYLNPDFSFRGFALSW